MISVLQSLRVLRLPPTRQWALTCSFQWLGVRYSPVHRRFLTSPPPGKPDVLSKPPFFVRVGIIGSAITLATPLFAVAGVFRIWSSVLPKTAEGLIAKRMISTLIGGGAVTLVWYYIFPFLRDYPDLILPFALSNGVMSMIWHGIAEATIGLDKLAGEVSMLSSKLSYDAVPQFWKRLPLGGALLGALTALSAPLLWGVATDLCWSAELKELLLGKSGVTWLLDTYYGAGMAVALPVGVLAGSSLHVVLKPFLLGGSGAISSMPWYSSSLPLLAATILACLMYYGNSRFRGSGIAIDDFLWMPRMDARTGTDVSVNVRSGERKSGHDTATLAAAKIGIIQVLLCRY